MVYNDTKNRLLYIGVGKQLGEMRIWRTARTPIAEILELFPEDSMGLLEYTKDDEELIVWNDIGVMGGSKGIRSVDGKKSVTMARA